jgi:hypothetical protein
MWPFSNKLRLPGVKQYADGTVEFTLTAEEHHRLAKTVDLFKGTSVDVDTAERIDGTNAVALSHYAKELLAPYDRMSLPEYGAKWPEVKKTLVKAVAAVWKAYNFYPLPVFIFHRARYMAMLGYDAESRLLFAEFLAAYSGFSSDRISDILLKREGTNIHEAVAHAWQQTSHSQH